MFLSLILLLVLLLQLMVCLRWECIVQFVCVCVDCILCNTCSGVLSPLPHSVSPIMPFLHINLQGVIKMSNIHYVPCANCIDSTEHTHIHTLSLVFGRWQHQPPLQNGAHIASVHSQCVLAHQHVFKSATWKKTKRRCRRKRISPNVHTTKSENLQRTGNMTKVGKNPAPKNWYNYLCELVSFGHFAGNQIY